MVVYGGDTGQPRIDEPLVSCRRLHRTLGRLLDEVPTQALA